MSWTSLGEQQCYMLWTATVMRPFASSSQPAENPNPKMPKGVFRSSPLTSSGFGGLAGMLRLLLQYGAEPDAINPEGYTNSIAATHNVDCALILLEWGADLNAVSTNGRTPLTTAIIYNNHPVLKLFVDRCYEYVTTARLKGT